MCGVTHLQADDAAVCSQPIFPGRCVQPGAHHTTPLHYMRTGSTLTIVRLQERVCGRPSAPLPRGGGGCGGAIREDTGALHRSHRRSTAAALSAPSHPTELMDVLTCNAGAERRY